MSLKEDRILALLNDAVGEENVSDRDAILIAYSRDNQWPFVPPHMPDYVVRPKTTEEVQNVLRIANRYRIPIIPMSSGINVRGLCIPTYGGILLELKRMDKLEIDEEMRAATVQPGVTIARLVAECAKHGLKPAVPGAPATVSPVSNYMLRGVYHHITSEGIDQVLTATVVLPTGEILYTGSSAFPNIDPYFRYFGPDLFGLFQGQPGTMGVVTEMAVKLYGMPEKTEVMNNFFGNLSDAMRFTNEVGKAGVASSHILMSWGIAFTTMGWVKSKFASSIYSALFSVAPWMTQTVVDGDEDAVEYEGKVVNKIMKRLDVKSEVTYEMLEKSSDLSDETKRATGITPSNPVPVMDMLTSDDVLDSLGTDVREMEETGMDLRKIKERLGVGVFKPVTPYTIEYEFKYPRKIANWFSRGNYWALAWWGPLNKVDKYWEETRNLWVECGLDPDELSMVVYPVYPYSGQPCYVELDAWMEYVADPSLIDKLKVFMEKETDKITDVGIYALFRPYRDVIKQTMPKLKGNYISLWRKIKDLIDPNNIMNPGALFEE